MGECNLEFANWGRGINIYSLETASLADVPSLSAEKITSFKDSSDLEDLIAEEMNEEVSYSTGSQISPNSLSVQLKLLADLYRGVREESHVTSTLISLRLNEANTVNVTLHWIKYGQKLGKLGK